MLALKTVFARLRQAAPVLLGALLFAAGVYALVRLLRPVHAADILAQVKATPLANLLGAFAATSLGYVALVGYDWSALRYLGKKLPAGIVAMGGFLGYSFGNTIGVSIVSGGAVRYRIYSAYGLNAFEVATISTFVALAFGIGITVVGLGALAYHPHALEGVLPWDSATTRLLAASGALATVAVMVWLSVSGKSLKIKRFELRAPSPAILLGQLGFTIADTVMAALTLYILLPAGAPDFITILALFSAAAMAGVLSHVPGGVGVFEGVILAGMPAGIALEDVVAALVLYRIIYYLIPFMLALVFVAINEARLAGGLVARLLGDVPEQMRPVAKMVNSIAPTITGVAAFGLGVFLVAIALIPTARPHEIDPNDLLAAILYEGGALLSSGLGVTLILLSHGLVRRISGAFWLMEVTLVAGAIASLLNGLDIESALLLIIAATILWPFRPEFYRSAKLTQGVFSPSWFALIFLIAVGVAGFFFFVHEATPYSTEIWTQFSGAATTPRALRAALLASALLTFVAIYLALQPSRAHSRLPDESALDLARTILMKQNNPEACLALSGDKSLFFTDAEDAFIMYARQGRSWVALADPVGPQCAIRDLIWAFYDDAYAANCRPVFYEVTEKYLPELVETGFTLHKMGEEAVVPLPAFSLAGKKFKSMRAAHNKALKSGLVFELHKPPYTEAFTAELQVVSDAWLGDKKGQEKGFSVGRFSPGYLSRLPVATVRRNGKILAFSTVMHTQSQRHIAIDIMRYYPEEASGMMEFLFINLMEYYRDHGAAEFSLGMAPLAGLEARHGLRLWNRFGGLLFRHGGAFYNFEGLRAFKQKFQPEWRTRFVAVPGGTLPLAALKDVAILISGGAAGLIRK